MCTWNRARPSLPQGPKYHDLVIMLEGTYNGRTSTVCVLQSSLLIGRLLVGMPNEKLELEMNRIPYICII